MWSIIDDFLNRTTMYRVVLYYLILLIGVAIGLSYFNLIPYSMVAIITSVLFLTLVGWATNTVFAKVFQVPTNVESVYISALILGLIITPPRQLSDWLFLGWASIITNAGKYIFNLKGKHLFNPVALAVVITSFTLNQSASWWIGTGFLLPFTLAGGYLVVRKIRRQDLVYSFWGAALVSLTFYTFVGHQNLLTNLVRFILDTPLIFLGTIMLTEPLTTPPTRWGRITYGVLVGWLFAPQVHLGSIYSTPELGLILGNLFVYLISPKVKLVLKLKEKINLGADAADFIFQPNRQVAYTPGQYMEWTLPHDRPDSRGNRRFFTLASATTESTLRLGVKFYPKMSSFKRQLWSMKPGETITAAQITGDFTLSRNKQRKYVFIAGGIGITPFRSMVKYLIDKQERRDIILFYANKTAGEIIYKEIFDQAAALLGIKVVYALTDLTKIPSNWRGETGRVDAQMITRQVPDYLERYYYLSGPHQMVTGFESVLQGLGISTERIVTDYFPGF